MMKHLPKHHTPMKNGKKFPREDLIYASKAEQAMIKHMTDGKADMTKHGILSFVDSEYGGGGSYNSGYGSASKSKNQNTGKTGTGGSQNQGRGGSDVGSGTSDRASGGQTSSSGRSDRAGNYNAGYGTASNSGSSRSGASASARGGQDFRGTSYPNSMPGNVDRGLNYGAQDQPSPLMQKAMDRNYANRMRQQYSQYRSPPGSGVEDLTRAAYDREFASPFSASGTAAGGIAPPVGGWGSLPVDPARTKARVKAVSRGPGAVAGVMPGASPISQTRTLQTLAGSMNEDPRFGGQQFTASGLRGLAKTIPGEAGNQSPMEQTAVANTMVNRMALAAQDPRKYGYMGGDLNSLMAQYDATGMRGNLSPNSAFENAGMGTDAMGGGIASLAGALASNSDFTTNAPDYVKNATHFLTKEAQRAQQKYPQGSRNWSNNPNQPFTAYGDHLFGNAEPTATTVASLRGTQPATQPTMMASAQGGIAPATGATGAASLGPAPPTQFAGVAPAVAPPQPQQQAQAETGPSIWEQGRELLNNGLVKTAWDKYTDANQKINSVGPKMAVALMGAGGGGTYNGNPSQGAGGGPDGGGMGRLPPATAAAAGGTVAPAVVQQGPEWSWVQWEPGQQPVPVPTSQLESIVGPFGFKRPNRSQPPPAPRQRRLLGGGMNRLPAPPPPRPRSLMPQFGVA